MKKALDELDKYLAESAVELEARRDGEFTAQEYVEKMLAKHGRVISNARARYYLNQDVKDNKLKIRRLPIGGKSTNLYSVKRTK